VRRRGAVTVIELLLVIVIVGAAVALYYGTWSRVRVNYHRMTCSSNLNQIAKGMHVYMVRYGGNSTFPVPAESFRGTDWLAVLYWKGLIIDPAVFLCPAQQMKPEMPMRADLQSYAWDGSASEPYCEYAARARGPRLLAAETTDFTESALTADKPLACDVDGNHADHINVVYFDGHVVRIKDGGRFVGVGGGGHDLEFMDDGIAELLPAPF